MSKSYVYVIKSGDSPKSPIKIGVSDDPVKRVKTLQTGNPSVLSLVITIECDSRKRAFYLEGMLHSNLKGVNVLGEWYQVKRNNFYKALNAMANNQDFSTIVKYQDLMPEKRTKLTDYTRSRLIKMINGFDKERQDMINKIKKQKIQSGIMRKELHKFGYKQSDVNDLFINKGSNDHYYLNSPKS